jgi:hypothetical protein
LAWGVREEVASEHVDLVKMSLSMMVKEKEGTSLSLSEGVRARRRKEKSWARGREKWAAEEKIHKGQGEREPMGNCSLARARCRVPVR